MEFRQTKGMNRKNMKRMKRMAYVNDDDDKIFGRLLHVEKCVAFCVLPRCFHSESFDL